MLTFAISHLIPSDPARLLAGDQASEEIVQSIREELGLDQPVYIQYVRYLAAAASGDLGASIRTGQAVTDDLARYFPATIELAVIALTLSILLSIPVGVASAVWKDRWPDQLTRVLAVAGISTPSFWLGIMLIHVFYGQLDLFPAGGRIGAEYEGSAASGFYLFESLLFGRTAAAADAAWRLALPAFTLAIASMGGMARLVRASMLDVLNEDYIRTARASGLHPAKIVFLYALPNALIPFVTALGVYLAHLLSGAVVTEIVFSWPGVGSYMMESVLALDFPAIMGFTLAISFVYILANLVVDLCYLALDPQIRDVG